MSMSGKSVELTSLCSVYEDYDGRIWLSRLADVKGQELVSPGIVDWSSKYFENRDKLYKNDGPSEVGAIGIWDWTAIPNRDDPTVDYVQTYYNPEIQPVRVAILPSIIQTIEDLVHGLLEGNVRVKPYFCDTFFCFQTMWGHYTGLLLTQAQFEIKDHYVILRDNVYSLPCYSIKTQDIYNWDDKHLRFLRSLQLGEPQGYVSIRNTNDLIRSVIAERMTWPLYKETVGTTKADWRNCKALFDRVCDVSLYELVAAALSCTVEQAKEYVDTFIDRASALLSEGDIDSEVLAQVALHNDALKSQCELALEESWKKEHAKSIAAAELEVEQIRTRATEELHEAQKKLKEIENKRSAADQDKAVILQNIAEGEAKLAGLLAEIEQYEALGNDTIEAVRTKIAAAQTDMASFIADISVFLPQAQHSLLATCPDISNYTAGSPLPGDDIDISESWEDEVSSLIGNLRAEFSVDLDLCGMLAAFLYSAHINNIPLLIAGPCGKEIADVLSASTLGRTADCLAICKDCRNDIVTGDDAPGILVVKNMFHEGWIDTLPQDFARSKKHVLWTHPYAEDLAIEPKGLYNYALPLFSECFVETVSLHDCIPAKRTENFNAYKSADIQPLRLRAINRLGLSGFLLNRLSRILTDAKIIFGKSNCEQDIELLFGLLPLAVLLGRNDLVQEVLENEKTISGAVRAEVKRYIKEE